MKEKKEKNFKNNKKTSRWKQVTSGLIIAVVVLAVGGVADMFISNDGIVDDNDQSMIRTGFDYIVYKSGSTIYVKNSTSGKMKTSGSDLFTVLDSVEADDTSILIKAGTYSQTAYWNCTAKNFAVYGEGMGATVIESDYNAGSNPISFNGDWGAGNITLSDFTFRYVGIGSNVNGLRFDSVDGVFISRVEITGFTNVGIFPGGTSPPYANIPSTNVWINDCHVHHNLGTGDLNSGIELGQCENTIIRHNYLHDNTRGIYLNGEVKNSSVTGNRLINCGNSSNGYIVCLSPVYNCTITENIVIDDGDCKMGIGLYSCDDVIISGNIVKGVSTEGIYLSNQNRGVISNNIVESSDRGMFAGGNNVDFNDNEVYVYTAGSKGIETIADNVNIKGNSIYGEFENSQCGIYAHNGNHYNIHDNFIKDFNGSSDYCGIRIGVSDYNDIKGNEIYDCGVGIRVDNNVHNMVKINDNTFANFSTYGIYVLSTIENFTISSNSIIDWSRTLWSEGGIHVEKGVNGCINDNVLSKLSGTAGKHVISIGTNSEDVTIDGNNFVVDAAQISQDDIEDDNATRTIINGFGINAGDPNSAGNWNGYGSQGLLIRDIHDDKIYCHNGTAYTALN